MRVSFAAPPFYGHAAFICMPNIARDGETGTLCIRPLRSLVLSSRYLKPLPETPSHRNYAVIDPAFARRFAADWIAAWNRHDLDAILAHYTDDFEMRSH